jgi:hypothetical protein
MPPPVRSVGLCEFCGRAVFSNEPRVAGRGFLDDGPWALHREHVEPWLKQLHDLMAGPPAN